MVDATTEASNVTANSTTGGGGGGGRSTASAVEGIGVEEGEEDEDDGSDEGEEGGAADVAAELAVDVAYLVPPGVGVPLQPHPSHGPRRPGRRRHHGCVELPRIGTKAKINWSE